MHAHTHPAVFEEQKLANSFGRNRQSLIHSNPFPTFDAYYHALCELILFEKGWRDPKKRSHLGKAPRHEGVTVKRDSI